ncbi:MaoC family dehydratase [Arthrobacter sp. ISL-5]|uniref:MaoC family dehydratase n=1 Tax=Arthrobacter sp. ISL-5 TaxID=2819111 RepID=UPI001BE9B560|nr:MaoC family dehydratase [Arthrobacter sp. ISL-5]MBT2555910.1 MaoC family dehydratase [Arthrobacter sp. ISL-5]
MQNKVQDLTVSVHDRYFEDYPQGLVCYYGSEFVSEQEIIGFARQYDPQWIHTDPVAAAGGPFGGLIASGWHTVSLMMRIFATSFWNEHAGLGGAGADELRWHRPVRPGDTLSAKFVVAEARKSRSKPDRGIVRTNIEVYRDANELVLTMSTTALIRIRPS